MFIYDFESIDPTYSLSQKESLAWLAKMHADHGDKKDQRLLQKRLAYYGVKPDRIAKRFVSCQDPTHFNEDSYKVFHRDRILDQKYKSQCFKESTESIFRRFYPTRQSLPNHLIHVTCTGYVAPSAAQILVGSWNAETSITHAYHMGCYAALPSLRMANAFSRGGSSRIDIVHTEMCSLHMDPRDNTPEQLVIQSLFADGFIKYSVSGKRPRGPHFSILSIEEKIIPDSTTDMKWEQEAWGLRMTLSRSVPKKIVDALPDFLTQVSASAKISEQDLLSHAMFAIHPGGPKIIDHVAQSLGLSDWQIAGSSQILFERGNMSSATLPHVWERILKNGLSTRKLIVSLAFGPGLTVFGSIFQIEHASR